MTESAVTAMAVPSTSTCKKDAITDKSSSVTPYGINSVFGSLYTYEAVTGNFIDIIYRWTSGVLGCGQHGG